MKKLENYIKTHSIFLHPSMLEAGHPNLTLWKQLALVFLL